MYKDKWRAIILVYLFVVVGHSLTVAPVLSPQGLVQYLSSPAQSERSDGGPTRSRVASGLGDEPQLPMAGEE